MADHLFNKQAAIYSEARPRYPSEWFSMLAALTPQHSVAWDVGTGNGQAAVGVSSLSVSLTLHLQLKILRYHRSWPLPTSHKHLSFHAFTSDHRLNYYSRHA
jgi:hypothetical protein